MLTRHSFAYSVKIKKNKQKKLKIILIQLNTTFGRMVRKPL